MKSTQTGTDSMVTPCPPASKLEHCQQRSGVVYLLRRCTPYNNLNRITVLPHSPSRDDRNKWKQCSADASLIVPPWVYSINVVEQVGHLTHSVLKKLKLASDISATEFRKKDR